jgi:hypothetical protein
VYGCITTKQRYTKEKNARLYHMSKTNSSVQITREGRLLILIQGHPVQILVKVFRGFLSPPTSAGTVPCIRPQHLPSIRSRLHCLLLPSDLTLFNASLTASLNKVQNMVVLLAASCHNDWTVTLVNDIDIDRSNIYRLFCQLIDKFWRAYGRYGRDEILDLK